MKSTTEHYTVLARRFRPQTFDDVIGQQHVAQSLKNAIRSNRVAHAYLFTGARGVGKTSMARILAKALNCPNANDGIPCNECEICDGISAGNDVDVQEIDGASNRGIDDIRTLRANVNVKSMRTSHKVYIIDEVHMLTKEAFNALLKTLEEPPPNVNFVFCTTEPNKVPDTILSRCQRFDFSTIETQNIVMRLKQIADVEGYAVEPAALELVARRAAGSMRDSQSLFDQLLAFGEEKISAEDVHRMLGTAADDRLTAIVKALSAQRRDLALQELDATLAAGVELGELVVQLVNYFRDLMVLAGGAETVPLLGVSDSFRGTLLEQSRNWGLPAIVAALEILVETKSRMFRASFGRALVEMALVRISMTADLHGIGALIQQIKDGTLPLPAPAKSVTSPSAPRRLPPSAPAPSTLKADVAEVASPTETTAEASPVTATPQTADESQNASQAESATVNVAETVPLEPGNESRIWAQVIERIDDATRSHLKPAKVPAISGPNQLDLLFPASYHFSKQFCDQQKIRLRLEEIVAQVVGRPVRIDIRLDQSKSANSTRVQEAATNPVKKPRNNLLKVAEKDPYVEEAVTIFSGTLREARELQSGGPEDSA